MKIFKIWQEENNGYDTYDSAVVIAENVTEAKKFHPGGTYDYDEEGNGKEDRPYGTWVKRKFVKARKIGETKHNCEKGVIVASFNAG